VATVIIVIRGAASGPVWLEGASNELRPSGEPVFRGGLFGVPRNGWSKTLAASRGQALGDGKKIYFEVNTETGIYDGWFVD
jgi:hypothetical protein